MESTLNVQLPSHFRDYLSTWNGQQERVPFLGYNSFLSIPGYPDRSILAFNSGFKSGEKRHFGTNL
ncbi:hypothetical protein J7E85_12240 [Paenibacillus sp. ISL-20]|nr:hypothetical protein [Paenibacillus sp. ISL-20]